MQQISFKNRIAFNYLFSTALLVLFVFVIIYNIVSFTVYSHVDADIESEVKTYLTEIQIKNNSIKLIDEEEWKEKEHTTLNVNPVFIQVLDSKKVVIDKSPNLKKSSLSFHEQFKDFDSYDTKLVGKSIRQTQFSVHDKEKIAGYILIAMSLEDANLVLSNLSKVLWISYPIILLLLFFTAQLIAGRSIRPIQNITETANNITRENLKARISLPQNKDELFVLSKTINDLLERIENAIVREKQFTSDASHELRTPLAVVKGTLEVLIRKPRGIQEYEEKIAYCISEVDRLNNLVDQLLLLARFENQNIVIDNRQIEVDGIILQSLERFSSKIESRKIAIDFKFEEHFYIHSDAHLVSTIIENLLSNALKYSNPDGKVQILLSRKNGAVLCEIIDNGIGIREEDLSKIYEQFYRSQATVHPTIKGTGLGLSIVKRLCDLLKIDITIESVEQSGTAVSILFPV